MKILAISHIFPPAIDGGSKVVYKLSQYFESQGHQVIYLSSDCSSTDDFVKKYKVSLFKGKTGLSGKGFIKLPVYHHLRRPLKFLNLFLPKNSYIYGFFKVFQKGPIFKLIPFLKATYQIIKFKPELIIAGPLPTTVILYANFLKNLINKINNFPFLSKGDTGLSGRGFCKLLINSSFHQTDPDFHYLPLIKTLKRADYLWTLTQYESNYFIKNLHLDSSKIILAGNGVDSEFIKKNYKVSLFKGKTGLSGKGLNILFIGSLSSHKRVDLLINSFSRLVKEGIKGRLVVVGQKTLFYPQIKKTYNSLPSNIKKRIEFKFNVVDQKQLIKIIDNCQFLVLPSIQESFGLVLIEAWARGKPVITSNIPPLQELVTKSRGGLTFKTDDTTDLQKQIEKLLNNPLLCSKLGQNGLNYVKNNYTWEQVGQKICQKI